MERRTGLALAAIATVYLLLCFTLALTRAPWYDEGQLANPSYDLTRKGTTGISALEESGLAVPLSEPLGLLRIRQRNYTEMPVYLVLLAGWFKLFGFGLLTMRTFTMVCGLAALLSWWFVVNRLTRDVTVAVLALALIAMDYGYVLRASEGRMDALSAAFGFGGLAAYLYFRERNFVRAVLFSHAGVAASAFTHPNGGMVAFAGLICLTLYYDARKIRFWHFAVAFIPYAIGAAGWAAYISRDVEAFRSQFSANARFGGRLNTFAQPWLTLKSEVLQRYLLSLGGLGEGASGLQRAKLIIPIAYAMGLAGVLSTSDLRRLKGYRALLLLTGAYFFVLAFSDGRKSMVYLVHVIPLYVTLLAAWIVWLWRAGSIPRMLLAAGVAVLCVVHVGGIAYQAKRDAYHQSYLPAVRFLRENARDTQLIMGSATLGFGLHYPPNLIDDIRLGARSGKTPDWIVVDEWYQGCFETMKVVEPAIYRFVTTRLDREYQRVYSHRSVTIFSRR